MQQTQFTTRTAKTPYIHQNLVITVTQSTTRITIPVFPSSNFGNEISSGPYDPPQIFYPPPSEKQYRNYFNLGSQKNSRPGKQNSSLRPNRRDFFLRSTCYSTYTCNKTSPTFTTPSRAQARGKEKFAPEVAVRW